MAEFFHHILLEFQLPLRNPVLVFSLILLIILLAPLLQRIKIPSVIGLIIAGVIIGPHGFNLLEKNTFVDIFSTIGLLYIMFIAGLELDLNEFKSNRNKSLVFGVFTFALPLILGYPVVHFLLGYDFNAAFLTASMFATHTLVAYPIVSKLGVSKNQAVAITVGGTILTDTAVLIILAVIMGNAQGGLDKEFWIRLSVSLVLFSFIMFYLIPKFARWFFKVMESEKHSHYIFVLAIVFFAAFLAEVAGLEPIIGAFAAGLALNKLIPTSSALMNRVEFIGNSIFIPFFLISVGMLVDVGVIVEGPEAIIVAVALTIVAVIGKWVAAYFTQKTFHYTNAQRQVIFGLSGAHAAATLAVILVGYNAHILDENILNGTIILILITSLIATFATERAAKKMKTESENDTESLMRSSGAADEQILLSISEVPNMDKLLDLAILIKDKNSQHPISLLSVVSNNDEAEVNIVKARNELETYVKEASASETDVKILTTIDKSKSKGITRIAREILADIILLDWTKVSVAFKQVIGNKTTDFINRTDKAIYICHINKPIALTSKIVLVAPPHAEQEKGFHRWVAKIAKLAQELSISIVLYSTESTKEAVVKEFEEKKLNPSLTHNLFEDWSDFFILAKDIQKNDLIVLISARIGTASYMEVLDSLPPKFEKYFQSNSYFVIYPQQDTAPDAILAAEDQHTGFLHSIGKDLLGSVFRKKKR